MFRMLLRYFKEYIGYYPPSRVDGKIDKVIQNTISPDVIQNTVSSEAILEFFQEMQTFKPARVNMASSHKPRFVSNDGVMTDLVSGEIR